MIKKFNIFIITLVAFFAANVLYAQNFDSEQSTIEISYTQFPEHEGEIYVLFHIIPKNNWHFYWQNPGDFGKEPHVEFTLPHFASASFLGFPPPVLIQEKNQTSYGYKKPFTLVYQINTKNILTPEDVKFNIHWLTCKKTCFPQEFSSTLTNKNKITIKQAQLEANKLPQDVFTGNVYTHKNVLTFEIPESKKHTFKNAYFFPKHQNHIITDDPQNFTNISPQKNILKVNIVENKDHIEGLLYLQTTNGDEQYLIVHHDVKEPHILEEESLLSLFLIALLGGLILNLMPCVFPVLSLKIMNILQHVKTKKGLLRHGLAYTGGIFASLMLLFLFVSSLKSAGYSVGWGFQLQSPLFISLLILLFSILFLNTFGLFEFQGIQTSSALEKVDQSKAISSFLNGILTTIVSTPCTAPFMGSAIAIALSQTYLESFFIFFGLSLGLASPFLFISLYPKTLNFLPKAGPWMQTLKEFLSFPLLGAIIWLLWILESIKPLLLIPIIIVISCISLLLWIYGTSQKYGKKIFSTLLIPFFITFSLWGIDKQNIYINSLFLLFIFFSIITSIFYLVQIIRSKKKNLVKNLVINIISAFILSLSTSHFIDTFEFGESILTPTPYSEEAIESALQKGESVFINYTARWCVTCQINKSSVLKSKRIQNAFKDYNVKYIEADWTNHSPTITESLKKYKRESIPFYVLIIPGKKEPIIFPELLTENSVLSAFKKIK